MLLKRKRLLLFKTIPEVIKEFPAAQFFIENKAGLYQEKALEMDDIEFLQYFVSDYILTLGPHFVCFAHPEAVVVMEIDVSFAIYASNELKIYLSKRHMEEDFTRMVFQHYSYVPHVRIIEKKLYSYEMAMDIHKRLNKFDIKILCKD